MLSLKSLAPLVMPPPDFGRFKAGRILRDLLALLLGLALVLPPPCNASYSALMICGLFWFTLGRMAVETKFKTLAINLLCAALAAGAGLGIADIGLRHPDARLPLLLALCATCFIARASWRPCGPVAMCALITCLLGTMVLKHNGTMTMIAGCVAALLGFLAAAFILGGAKPSKLASKALATARAETSSTLAEIRDTLLHGAELSATSRQTKLARSAVETLASELPPGVESVALRDMAVALLRLERALAMAAYSANAMRKHSAMEFAALAPVIHSLEKGAKKVDGQFDEALVHARAKHLSDASAKCPFLMTISLLESLERVSANLKAAQTALEAMP